MKYKVTTKDSKEAKRLAKATDMAIVLFEFAYNSRKKCYGECASEGQTIGVDIAFEKFHELLDEHDIIIDDIIE